VGNWAGGDGTLSISDGAKAINTGAYFFIGYQSSSTGVVTVDGSGSSLESYGTSSFHVGSSGHGSLVITNGGTVYSAAGPLIAAESGGTGSVIIDGTGSSFTSGGICWVGGGNGTGVISITGGGSAVASDFRIQGPTGQPSIVTVDGSGSTLQANGTNGLLVLGSTGEGGMLTVRNGADATSKEGRIGAGGSGPGEVTIDGAGSTWNNSGQMYVGYAANSSGKLSILNGASVSNGGRSYIAYSPIPGRVTLDGTGSTWNNAENLYVGRSNSSGTLSISGGAAVTAQLIEVNVPSLLAIDVGTGSSLSTGTLKNSGTVRILAGAGPTAGSQYAPIGAAGWTGSGGYQAVGGKWDSNTHQITVSDVATGLAGTPVNINLPAVQRILVADNEHGWTVGASFLDKSGTLDFTATVSSIDELAALSLLTPGQNILGAWDFAASGSGYAAGDPVYLSLDVGFGLSRSDLTVWHYDSSNWSAFDALDLTCNSQWASFTVDSFSGYAVTSVVPEPATLPLWLLMGGGGLSLFYCRRWRTRAKASE
jgi:T5SS/PEP-CTERM-associated repeat protein